MMTPQARRALGGVAALVIFGCGILVGTAASGHSTSTTPGSGLPGGSSSSGNDTKPTSALGPTRTVAGVPVGYPDTKSGALSAAANYTAAVGGSATLTSSGRAGIVKAIAAPGSADALQSQLNNSDPALAPLKNDQVQQNPFVLRTVPLAVKATSYNQDAATVQVFALALSASTQSTASSGYATGTVNVVWAEGDWKLQQYGAPSPVVGPMVNGYAAPANGWQTTNGQSLYDVGSNFRSEMNSGAVPSYVVP